MKIGKFAEHNNATIDTIRHYIDLGLLVPDKTGSQYDFDDQCQQDLETIFKLKEMAFQLNEIKNIMTLLRLGHLTVFEEHEYFKSFFIKKKQELSREIEQLTKAQEMLENQIDQLEKYSHEAVHTYGVPLSALSVIACNRCGNKVSFKNGTIKDNQVIEGQLTCTCGNSYQIIDGILHVDSDLYDKEQTKISETFIYDYVTETDAQYIDAIYKGQEWGHRRMDASWFQDKIILDLGSGSGFFLRNSLKFIGDDALYFAVDHDINRHIYMKKALEMHDVKKNIIFVCSDFKNIPLANHTVDTVIDYAGSSNYNFDTSGWLLKVVDHLLKTNVKIIASFILFEKFGFDSIIPEVNRQFFSLDDIKTTLAQLGYKSLHDIHGDKITKGGKYEGYFKEDEIVSFYKFIGER